ncbi:MAG: YiiG family protein [Alphaproteobacteria bacterium]
MQLFFPKILTARFLAVFVACQFVTFSQTALAEDQLNEKLQPYIKCFNTLDRQVHKTIGRYASWVKDFKKGPTGKERVVYGVYTISGSDITKCSKKFSDAQGVQPKLPLDGFAAKYIKSVEGINQVINEMHPYYDRGDYKDDKFAKGKKLHSQFVAQVEPFLEASKLFSQELDVVNDKRIEAQMAALEKKHGRNLPYLNMATMHKAKLLVRLVSQETFPVDQAVTRISDFSMAIDEELKFAKNNPDGLPLLWSSYTSALEKFLIAAKERMRRVRDKTPYNVAEESMIKHNAAKMVKGTQQHTISKYNDLIRSSNQLK